LGTGSPPPKGGEPVMEVKDALQLMLQFGMFVIALIALLTNDFFRGHKK
jgi:hypothetical protein